MSKAKFCWRDSYENSEGINVHVMLMSHDMFLCYRTDTNVDQTITCTKEQQGQEEFYIDVSSDDEQMESLVCAAKKEGSYYVRCCIISKDH